MKTINILLVGAGGREHALAWKLAQSPRLGRLFIAPGNPGTISLGENVLLDVDDHAALIQFCQEKQIDLVVVGPEVPLANGIADILARAGISCFGPRQAAAQIEASKVFAKNFMARHGIPTARFATFQKLTEALDYLQTVDYPVVIKASGLAAGKGVVLPETQADAESTLREMLENGAFGLAGTEVVIEERMNGPEVSLMAFTDGQTVVPMLAAQDHKRIFDDDHGPNTGGMGAYAPAPNFTAALLAEALESVLKPAISGLRLEGIPFVGVLYAGLMLTSAGLRVIEFNCRFGDPEAQVVLPLLETDLVEIAEACVAGTLAETEIRWKQGAAVCVVMASNGYPGQAAHGQLATIGGLPENAICFQAGTKLAIDGMLTTAGGRVFGVTAWAHSLAEAVVSAYDAVDEIHFSGAQYRTDIAARALQAESRIDIEADDLIYKVNGLARQVYSELGPGQAEQKYQRRLAELCLKAGLTVEIEKQIEVWIANQLMGDLKLGLLLEERLIVACKASLHFIGSPEIEQMLTSLAAGAGKVGMIYNFGMDRVQPRRILAAQDAQAWRKNLYRFIQPSPGMVLPPLGQNPNLLPIRFNAVASGAKPTPVPEQLIESAYAASGVSIDAGNRAIELMKDAVKATYTPAVLAGIGSFGGLFDASSLKQMKNPVLVASTDGVGTKVKLAASVGRYRGIGHDIVNHCIDDILVQGARPLFFMDYFATSKLNPEQTAEVVTGIAEACQQAGMALLGGETAEMPGVYASGEFDVAGTIVGVLERDQILPRTSQLKAGDVLIGLRSSSPHTNGFSLIRKIFAETPLETVFPELGIPLADALLAPHRSYFNLLNSALSQPQLIKALAHLTGGGFIENIPRILPPGLDAVIRLGSWPMPPLWQLIQRKGNIATEEMYRVFNMGIGMVVLADKASAAEIQKLIPEETFIIGELTIGSRKTRLSA